MRRWLTILALVVLPTVTAAAQTLYIPASANAAGANNTNWRTDLQVKARGDDGASFTVELLESRAANTDPMTLDFGIAAGESLRLENLIGAGFGFTGTAALRLIPTEGEIIVSSRTFNDDPGGTYGQTVPAVEEGSAIGFGETATLVQLSRSPDPTAGFRTNIGFVNLADHSSEVVVDLYDAAGGAIGAVTKNLKANEHRQLNDVFSTVGAADVPDGYATVRTTDADGALIAYASVVDNGSGDAVFILAQNEVEVEAPPAGDRLVVFESFRRAGCPICTLAGTALRQLKQDYDDRNVLFIEQDVDASMGNRIDRWFDGFRCPGNVYLPLVMVDSGNCVNNGEQDFQEVYADIIDGALARPTMAEMSVAAERTGSTLHLDVRITNLSGAVLTTTNAARLNVLVWEEPTDASEIPVVSKSASKAITNLGDGDSRTISLEVGVGGVNESRMRWVVIADYLPFGSSQPFDTLQAVHGP